MAKHRRKTQAARLGDRSYPSMTPSVTASRNVLIGGRPAVRRGDRGLKWVAVEGAAHVLVNDRLLHRVFDEHSSSEQCEGAAFTLVGDLDADDADHSEPRDIQVKIRVIDCRTGEAVAREKLEGLWVNGQVAYDASNPKATVHDETRLVDGQTDEAGAVTILFGEAELKTSPSVIIVMKSFACIAMADLPPKTSLETLRVQWRGHQDADAWGWWLVSDDAAGRAREFRVRTVLAIPAQAATACIDIVLLALVYSQPVWDGLDDSAPGTSNRFILAPATDAGRRGMHIVTMYRLVQGLPGREYGKYRAATRSGHLHGGYDLHGRSNVDTIFAVHKGTVEVLIDDGTDAGNRVWLSRDGGRSLAFFHLASFAVDNGAHVRAGQILGVIDRTGNLVGQYPTHVHIQGPLLDFPPPGRNHVCLPDNATTGLVLPCACEVPLHAENPSRCILLLRSIRPVVAAPPDATQSNRLPRRPVEEEGSKFARACWALKEGSCPHAAHITTEERERWLPRHTTP